MPGPEYKLQIKVLKALRAIPGVWCYKANDRTTSGLPDIIGCVRGHTFAIELKAPGERPTAIQKRTLARLRDAGATCGVAWTVKQALDLVSAASVIECLKRDTALFFDEYPLSRVAVPKKAK